MHDSQDSYYRDPEFLEILAKWEDIEERGGGYMDADDLADVAEYYYTNHQRNRGDRCIDFALKLHPTAVDVLTFKARSFMLQRRYDEVSVILDKANDQDNRELIYLRAELLIVAGRRRAADVLLQEHMPEEDDDEEPHTVSSYLREVIGLWLDYDDMIHSSQWADRLRAQSDLDDRDRIMLADYASAAGQTNVARSILQDIVENDPYNISAWNLLAEVGMNEENYQEAAEACETVLAIDEDNYQATTQLGRIYYTQSNWKEAVHLLHSVRDKWPEDEICLLYEGMSLLQMYYNKEDVDITLLNEAYNCVQEAERRADGQSIEQANIVLNMAYIMGEYYFTANDVVLKGGYRQRTIDYIKNMRQFGNEVSQVSFQLSNILLEMGEHKLANELLDDMLHNKQYPDHAG